MNQFERFYMMTRSIKYYNNNREVTAWRYQWEISETPRHPKHCTARWRWNKGPQLMTHDNFPAARTNTRIAMKRKAAVPLLHPSPGRLLPALLAPGIHHLPTPTTPPYLPRTVTFKPLPIFTPTPPSSSSNFPPVCEPDSHAHTQQGLHETTRYPFQPPALPPRWSLSLSDVRFLHFDLICLIKHLISSAARKMKKIPYAAVECTRVLEWGREKTWDKERERAKGYYGLQQTSVGTGYHWRSWNSSHNVNLYI